MEITKAFPERTDVSKKYNLKVLSIDAVEKFYFNFLLRIYVVFIVDTYFILN